MIVIEEYTSPTAENLLYKIYSNNGFFLKKNETIYSEVIISTPEEKNEYIETQIPIQEAVASLEEIYKIFFSSNQNITKNQAIKAKAIVLKALFNLKDEDAYLVKFLFPEWQANIAYEIGERIVYNGELYNVIKTPSNNLFPKDNQECYKLTQKPLNLIEEWDFINHKIYNVGEKVKVGNHYYESIINNNVWSPQDFPTAWKLIEGSQV